MRTPLRTLLIGLLAPVAVALAQGNPPPTAAAPPKDPLATHARMMYGGVKVVLLRSAERMPEENYGFKPTESVRTFGQILGHVADSHYMFCSGALGEKRPAVKVEQTKTSKADLIAALKEALAYCDKAYDGLTDASAAQMVGHGSGTPKLGLLTVASLHSIEHYGNLIVYLRMKNIVPPSSDPGFVQEMRKQ
ncbi:MAG TPA: DinB family protein [Thermoanaerobaculia bacterium]|nr:DinB family protein [Thermoanaerobaculia bacterium]